MLPPFIIEQIRKREEEERKRDERPRLELPLHTPGGQHTIEPRGESDEENRGVVIVDLGS